MAVPVGGESDEIMRLEDIVSDPVVREARAEIHRRDDETVAEQERVVRIAAPTGEEAARAAYVARRFETIGLDAPAIDDVGNVIGTLPRRESDGRTDRAPVIVSAHLDTIFPPGTAVIPHTVEDRIHAPGITDNSRGVAALLRIAETLVTSGLATRHPLVFVATVGEEGLGDLRGVKHLFTAGSAFRGAAGFISIDGAGAARVIHRAIGARRLRVVITGRGGHSWGDRGLANPAFALGAAIARLPSLSPVRDPDCAVNVGRLGGGTSVNAIPSEVWCEVDLRASRPDRLSVLETRAREIFEEAARAEGQRSAWGVPLACGVEVIGSRPCGETPPESPIVRAAVAATRLVGETAELTASSTDANVPMSIGIPAITIGAGGHGGGIHTPGEWYDNRDGARGIERALLITLAIAGLRAGQPSFARASATE